MKKESDRQKDSLIFEGMTSLRAVLKADGGGDRIVCIYFDKAKTKQKKQDLEFIRKMSCKHGFAVTLCDRGQIDSMATGSTHGGIIFECRSRRIPDISELNFNETGSGGIGGFYIMIEGIEDPYNFGYALRSIYAAGAAGAVLTPRNWMSAAGVVCRASAGASELLPMYSSEPEDACRVFRKAGYHIVCAGIRDSVPVYECTLTPPVFLIIGGEKRGLSAKVLKEADDIVRLDYGRRFNGSLSAASAASILAYEVFRQTRFKN